MLANPHNSQVVQMYVEAYLYLLVVAPFTSICPIYKISRKRQRIQSFSLPTSLIALRRRLSQAVKKTRQSKANVEHLHVSCSTRK